MGKVKDEQLFSLLRNFLLIYLPNQRHASSNTVKAYRTAWNQLLKYIAEQKKISMMSVTFEMIRYEMVLAYLDWLSEEKGISPATRNNRLAAIRAFITYASACRPEYISLSSELAAIKIQKKERFREVDYMSEDAVKALFAAPDTRTKMGLRDQFLMIFLYDTGARIQETLDVKICDLRIDKTPTVTLHGKGGKIRVVPLMKDTVTLHGKGGKIRVVPLMKDTVQHLDNYMGVFHKGESVFSTEWLFYVERKGSRSAMCDDTARLRIQKYAELARENCPDVPERVHPHLWRHTRAMHLYQHGMDLTMISQWLGHKQVETTLIYAYADTEAKRKAIEKAMGTGLAGTESVNYTVSDEDMLRRLYGL